MTLSGVFFRAFCFSHFGLMLVRVLGHIFKLLKPLRAQLLRLDIRALSVKPVNEPITLLF